MTFLHKNTCPSLLDYANLIYKFVDVAGRNCQLLSDEVYQIFVDHHAQLQSWIDYSLDFTYEFFGLKTLEKSYLLKVLNKIAERPQQLIMRVAVGIHGNNLEKVHETYQLMSQKWFTHATPTLFNAGTPYPQMSSCFLLSMTEDSIEGIYETLRRCALISKSAGGIGVSINNVRAQGSYIRGTNGISNGIIPMIRVYNATARYVDQGGGKRKGSFALYLEPWHADIHDFLELKKNHGKEEMRARDLFYGLWTPDLFMRRVKTDADWTLMCPAECPGLNECYGEKFDQLYEKYEREGKGRKTVKARHLWNEILSVQIETGTPYILYKDACNEKSNQKNLGTIRCSNLCTEIIEYTSPDEVAVCNLASISLPKFVRPDKTYDFEGLVRISRVITRNLNKVIDRNFYPVIEAKNSNFRHRPIGIGVQGLADTYALMRLNYDSKEALELNNRMFESIYYGACVESHDLAKTEGPYQTFPGSPASQGILQFDMWGIKPTMYDWSTLKKLYRTVWEIPQKAIIDLAVGRGPFIDQSQSLNIFLAQPDKSQMNSMHFYGWEKGLKTGMYYLRTKAATDAIKFTVDPTTVKEAKDADFGLNKRGELETLGTVNGVKKTKLATVNADDYEEEECLNCGA